MTTSRFLSVVLLSAICTFEVQTQEVRLFAIHADSGVHLRWIGNTDPQVTGWHVERSTDGNSFQRLTPQPLPIITSFEVMTSVVGKYKAMYYLTLFGVKDLRDLSAQDIARTLESRHVNLHLALRAASAETAILSGEYFFDLLPTGEQWTYRVIPMREEAEGTASAAITVNASDPGVLPKPSSITAHGMDNATQFTWPRPTSDGSSEIVGYRVWRATNEHGPFEEVTLLTSVPLFESKENMQEYRWTDDLVDQNDTLFYYIRYVHATGLLSSRSNIIRVVASADEPPVAAQRVTAERFGHAVRLTWTWPWQSKQPARATLVRIDENGTAQDFFLTRNDTSYIDALADVGSVYRYAVVTYNANDSVSSDTISFHLTDVAPPLPPTNVLAKSDTAKIHLSWTKSASNDVVGYVVMVAADDRLRNYLRLRSNLITDTALTDTVEREAEGPFSYVIMAEDKFGNTSVPSAPIVSKPIDVNPPAPSQIVDCKRMGQRVSLRYTQSTSKDVESYIVQRLSGGSEWVQKSNARTLEATDSVIIPGTYQYRVIVIDSSGNKSTPSQIRSLTVRKELNAPATLTVQLDSLALTLHWSEVEGAAGYEISRVDLQTGERMVLDNVSKNITNWSDTFSDADRSWQYGVAARTEAWVFGTPRFVVYRPTK